MVAAFRRRAHDVYGPPLVPAGTPSPAST
jgi:hypothetical protein